MKFKAGDIVKATTDRYTFTTEKYHWYGVVDTCGHDAFSARTIYSDIKEYENDTYGDLKYNRFEKASIDEIAMIYYMREHDLYIGERFNLPNYPFRWDPYYVDDDLQIIDTKGHILDWIVVDKRAQKVEKIIEPEIKEMTVAEIEKELGYKVKVVKG